MWRKRYQSFWVLGLGMLLGLLLTGCGSAKTQTPPGPAESTAAPKTGAGPVESSAIPAESTENSLAVALVPTATNGTAESTFQQVLVAFQEGRLEAVFDFLPPSHQAEVEQLLQTFADKMDPELWSDLFQLLNKSANLLKSKKELILSLDGVKKLPQIDAIKPYWEGITNGLRDAATSDIADLKQLKRANTRQLLAAGSRLLAGMQLPSFADIEVTTVQATDEQATLSYRDAKNAAAKQVEFVRVEGKWLPQSIATGWPVAMADAKARLAELPSQLAILKPEALRQMSSIAGMLDQLQGAKTKDEFSAAAVPLVFTVAFGAQMAQQAMQDAATTPRQGNAVHLIINRELTDGELTRLKTAVFESLGDSAANTDYEFIPNDGKTRCRFVPITDLPGLLTVLKKHFEGTSVRLDAETKTIFVDGN